MSHEDKISRHFPLGLCHLVTVNIVKHIEPAMRAEQKLNNFSLNIVLKNTKLVKEKLSMSLREGLFLNE